jgi:3-ketosteroid 9alpha-monooxygenase subunit B
LSQINPPDPQSNDPRHQYHELEVVEVVSETRDAKSFVFDVPDALREIFDYVPGQFFTFRIPWADFTIDRCYSLSSAPQWGEKPKVTIKRIDDGRMSNWMNDNLKPGDRIPVMPPAGLFVLHERSIPLVLFGGGSGITPVISLLKHALRETDRKIKMVYANRDLDSVIFKAELDEMVAQHADRLALVHHLDSEIGFLTRERVNAHVADWLDADFYICGPTPFMDTIENALADSQLRGGHVHVERFVSALDPDRAKDREVTPEPEATGHPESITVHLDGNRHEVDYNEGETILAAAIRAGLDVPFSCQDGYCSCCMAKFKQGEVFMASREALTDKDIEKGWILTCQAKPTTGSCEVEYEE